MLGWLCGCLRILKSTCGHLCSCLRDSPLVFCLVTAAILIIASGILIFNICLARLFTVPGALVLNLGFIWLLLRLVVRALVFPGSIVLWKRNTEASYRVEMAKQFAHHVEHLHAFLSLASKQKTGSIPGVTIEGVSLGCTVIEGLARNFRIQQRDQVRFTAEQTHVKSLVHAVESWLTEAKVRSKGKKASSEEQQAPLVDWIQKTARSIVPVPLSCALAGVELVTGTEAGPIIDRLEQLLIIFDSLQSPKDNCCVNARRFLRVPTVGSLHQLRAELQVRYAGRHYWVRAPGGRKIDGMFISCQGAECGLGPEEELPDTKGTASKEEIPLKDMADSQAFTGPTMIWCNPNAGYYETMVYESHWLDLYLAQGCNVFLFNYSGFGRSTGHPSPSALAADGDAVVEFLKRRGVTQIGVHGRSIGGICATHMAARHPDHVKILVADRTMSTLAEVAKYTFGNWAVKGLSLSATWADNLRHYSKARCYKVMICDPKDATIPDLASLRTSVAIEELERLPASERFVLEDERIQRITEAWFFFDVLFGVCDREDGSSDGSRCSSCRSSLSEAKRPARQPVLGNPAADADVRLEVGEEDTQRLVGSSRNRPEVRESTVTMQWVEEHMDFARTTMAPHIDAVRSALDHVGSQLNAGGMTLEDALGRTHAYDDLQHSLRCFLANIQVWGSLGSLREPLCPHTDKDTELFLTRSGDQVESPELVARLARIGAALNPEKLSTYHRQLARSQVLQARREFRSRLASIRRTLEPCAQNDGQASSRLCSTVLSHLREIDGFLSSLYRFFKCVDLASEKGTPKISTQEGVDVELGRISVDSSPSVSSETGVSGDSSEEGGDNVPLRPPRPVFDRTGIGYGVWVDCGHNGVFCEGEVMHFLLHLRAAGFGRSSPESDSKSSTKAAGQIT